MTNEVDDDVRGRVLDSGKIGLTYTKMWDFTSNTEIFILRSMAKVLDIHRARQNMACFNLLLLNYEIIISILVSIVVVVRK